MVEGNDAEKTGIEVVAIVPEIKEEATVALVEAFKTEETTAYHLDMKHPGSIRRMAIFDDIFIQLYMEAGRPLYAAVEDGHVIGAGIVRDPRIRISKRRSVALILPDLLQILLLFARRPVRSLHIMVAAKHPKGLIEPYFTFEALGVHPDHQGRGDLGHVPEYREREEPGLLRKPRLRYPAHRGPGPGEGLSHVLAEPLLQLMKKARGRVPVTCRPASQPYAFPQTPIPPRVSPFSLPAPPAAPSRESSDGTRQRDIITN